MQRNLKLREAGFQFHRRHLPHYQFAGGVYFVTFRLFGSLPSCWQDRLADGEELHGDCERRLDQAMSKFRETERILDGAGRGPTWLGEPAVASMVCGSLHHGDGQLYRLHRYVVMPNHVHALIEPITFDEERKLLPSLSLIMERLKGFTARRANQLLGRKGTFWQAEYFDHGVRNDDWYHRFINYIDENPVLAGLAASAGEWPWGSAGEPGFDVE